MEEALQISAKYKIEKLPLVMKILNLKGLITIKDIEKAQKYPIRPRTSGGLSVGAARWGSALNTLNRVEALKTGRVE